MQGSNAGGLLGYTSYVESITIKNCYNEGNITGGNTIGGLIACVDVTNLTIQDSYNAGSISGTGSYIGAIAGSIDRSEITMTNCNDKTGFAKLVGYTSRSNGAIDD